MSSVIVLDSSDEEEVPTKKAFLAPSIPATITPIKTTTSKCPTANQLKHKKTKPRTIPSGITITRRSPVNLSTASPNLNNNNNNTNTSAANTNTRPPSFNDSFVAATISAATLAATSKLNSILSINKTGTATASSILKTNATTKERQTPTPPRQQTQQQMQAGQKTQQQQQMQATKQQQQAAQQVSRQQQQSQQVLPHLSQLPQLQPSPLVLSKRLSATPIQQQPAPKLQKLKQQQNLPKMQTQQQKQRTLNASPATITPINIGVNQMSKTATSSATAAMLPMISSVQSMAASATPPLQLLATPPHSAATTFSDHQLFSPKSMHTTCSLPPSTTVTATRPQMSSSGNNNNNTNISSSSSNNKNINNNFKIMLPPKSSTNTTPTSTPTPVALQQISAGPRIAYVNSLAPQNQLTTTTTSNNNKATNSNNKNSTATTAAALPIPIGLTATATAAASTAAQSPIMPTVSSGLASVRRVKPTTLLRKNDEAWLNRSTSNAATPAAAAPPTTAAAKNFFDDDLALELLPHSRSSTYHTNTKTAAQKAAAAEFVKNMALRTPIVDSDTDDSMLIIPNTLTITSTRNSYSSSSSSTQKSVLRKSYPLKIDLTDSPEKAYKARNSNTPTVTPPPAPPLASVVVKSKSIERITNGGAKSTTTPTTPTPPTPPSPPPLSTEYEELLKVCAAADSSADMGKLVKSKLPKYYHNAHPDFVRSKGFSKSLRTVITNIQKEPNLVYLHLKTIVDELKVRSKSKEVLPAAVVIKSEAQNADVAIVESVSGGNGVASGSSNTGAGGTVADSPPVEDPASTGNKHTDEQIKKLNKALYILTKRIEVLEAAEVDWEDEDSSYLQVERFKKRACQIYEKICDLTGESKNAHRLVKKPIHFNGTTYTQFNKTLQAYVNRTKEFPDYFDVLRMLEHCNRQYDYALANFEMKRIAHDAFIKIGKLLQSRRKTDLYETVTHFTAHEKDPATIDPALQAKLSENQKKRTRISDVIEKYAREQDMIREELKEARQAKVAKAFKSGSSDDEDDDDNVEEDDAVASTSSSAAKVAVKRTNKKHKKENGETADKENNDVIALDGDDDDDDDDEDEDEDEVNGSDLEADVEKLANGYLSDVDSDVEIVINNTTEEFDSETQKEDDKTKDKKDSLTAVVEDRTEIATKDKLKADATLKTQKVDTIPQTTTPTEQQQQLSNISINSNGTRQKTADPLTIATQQANKATPTTTSTTTEIDGSKIVTAAGIANGCMKSVTDPNLENKTNIVVDKEGETIVADHQSSCSVTMQTQKQSTTTTTKEGTH